MKSWTGRYIKAAMLCGGIAALVVGTTAGVVTARAHDSMTRGWAPAAAGLWGVLAMWIGVAVGLIGVRAYKAYVDWTARQYARGDQHGQHV